jgi:hypothetical protein
MTPPGWNPIRWDCKKQGCRFIKTAPKLEQFAECFPGLNNFGDVDGLVERGGAFCVLEWKTPGARLKTAQVLTFKAMSRIHGSVVFAVEGEAEIMDVRKVSVFWRGQHSKWKPSSFIALKSWIKGWADERWGRAPIGRFGIQVERIFGIHIAPQDTPYRMAIKGDTRP